MPELTRRILKSYNVWLASASPRRAELIKKITWINATVYPSDIVEPEYSGGNVAEYACTLAKMKAANVFARVGGTVIGADTVVYVGKKLLAKPKTAEEADGMFKLLCGHTHEVITGYCVMGESKSELGSEITYVTFGNYEEYGGIIRKYIQSGAPFDKAGGYGIQDRELSPLVKVIDGDVNNVIGLPVSALTRTLRSFFEWQ